MKGRSIRVAISVTLLVISGMFWLLLLLGTSEADRSLGSALLGGLIISAIPIGIGVWLLRRDRASREGAPTADSPAGLSSASPPAVEVARVDTPPAAKRVGKAGLSPSKSRGAINLSWYEWVPVLLPIVLFIPGFTGGALGGAAFGAGFLLNLRIMRSDEPLSKRAAEAVGVTIGLIAIYIVVANLLSAALSR